MARHIRNPKIESKTARARLKPSGKPTYFDLGGKLHLGYRRGKGAGRWVMRYYLGGEKYATQTLGEADDLADANGTTVLNFDQAQDRARERMKALDEEARIAALGPVVTVGDAVEAYIAERSKRETPDISKLTKHVLKADPALSAKSLAALRAEDLIQWRERLAASETSTRKRSAGRISETSVRRIANDFRAALNSGGKRLSSELPLTFHVAVKNGLAAPRDSATGSEREPQILADADVRRLLTAAWGIDKEQGWGGDLGRMILVLAYGVRLSQAARLRVADLQVGKALLMVPTSRKGSKNKKRPPATVPLLPEDALKLATVGRLESDRLLLRPRWRREPGQGFGAMKVYQRGPWRAASELTRVWKDVVARAGLPKETIPYAFRHSSIVRGLRGGLPIRLVAALHDTSSAVIEASYSAYITDALSELARAALVPLMTPPVTSLDAVRRGEAG
jgi:integrase